jgi:hypothetical protein
MERGLSPPLPVAGAFPKASHKDMSTTLSSRLNILCTPTEMLYRTTDNDPFRHFGE